MSKTSNPIKKKTITTKKRNIIASHNRDMDSKNPYLSSDAWRIVPITEGSIDRLCRDLYSWIEDNPEALCFDRFLMEKRLGKTCYYEWVQKWPQLKKAHKHVIMCLGVHREEGGLKNKLNAAMVTYSQPMYNEEWQKHMIERAELKKSKEDIDATRNIVINMTKFPESELVPRKKTNESE